jgi:hypothetical protein
LKCPLKKTQPSCPCSRELNWTGKGLNKKFGKTSVRVAVRTSQAEKVRYKNNEQYNTQKKNSYRVAQDHRKIRNTEYTTWKTDFNKTFKFLDTISKNSKIQYFMIISPMGRELTLSRLTTYNVVPQR